MKITICGKGGCGKSTVTTLLAKELARMGKKVLVVDSDESNFGLHRQLGVELPRDFTEYFGGKDKAFKTMMTAGIQDSMKLSAFAKKFFSEDFTMADIPEEYYSEKDGVMVDAVPGAECYCTDGYSGYLDVVFPGKHIFNIHNKNDTFTVEGVNADLRHYIPTLARRSRCFPRKLENLQAVLAVFVKAYNRFGRQKELYRSYHPETSVPLSLFDFL